MNHRQLSFFLWVTRIVGCSCKKISRNWEKQTPGCPLSCCDDDWLSPPAAKTQTVKNFPSEFTGATGRITLENSLVGGSIHSVLGTF